MMLSISEKEFRVCLDALGIAAHAEAGHSQAPHLIRPDDTVYAKVSVALRGRKREARATIKKLRGR